MHASRAMNLERHVRDRLVALYSSVSKGFNKKEILSHLAVKHRIVYSLRHMTLNTCRSRAPVSSTRKLISSSFHRLDMTLAVAEALNP